MSALLRLYLDTSVYGDCFDPEFEVASRLVFRRIPKARIVVIVSEVVFRELRRAPPHVQRVLASIPAELIVSVPIGKDVEMLRDAYIAEGIVGTRSLADATHVAAATVGRANAILSWNFKDIVRFDHVAGFNRVNLHLGFGNLQIMSPDRIGFDDED